MCVPARRIRAFRLTPGSWLADWDAEPNGYRGSELILWPFFIAIWNCYFYGPLCEIWGVGAFGFDLLD